MGIEAAEERTKIIIYLRVRIEAWPEPYRSTINMLLKEIENHKHKEPGIIEKLLAKIKNNNDNK
jgi:hypothetical protein